MASVGAPACPYLPGPQHLPKQAPWPGSKKIISQKKKAEAANGAGAMAKLQQIISKKITAPIFLFDFTIRTVDQMTALL